MVARSFYEMPCSFPALRSRIFAMRSMVFGLRENTSDLWERTYVSARGDIKTRRAKKHSAYRFSDV